MTNAVKLLCLAWMVAAVPACGKKESAAPAPAPSAAAPAAPAANTASAAGDDKTPPPSAEEPTKGVPAELAALKVPQPAKRVKDPSMELFSFELPDGVTIKKGPSGKWTEMSGRSWTMAMMAHNPSGDDGPGCPKVADMKAKVTGAKAVLDKAFELEMDTDKNESQGDENAYFLFEKDGKFGFYATKLFDHGDDATTYCFAPGKAGEATRLTTLLDRSAVDEMLAIVVSLKFNF